MSAPAKAGAKDAGVAAKPEAGKDGKDKTEEKTNKPQSVLELLEEDDEFEVISDLRAPQQ